MLEIHLNLKNKNRIYELCFFLIQHINCVEGINKYEKKNK